MKKIISFLGSPNKNGNTSILVNRAIQGAVSKKADVREFYLNSLVLKGCQACMSCRKTRWCAVKDDARQILEDIPDCDGIIFGTPVYMFEMTGQMKLLIDRFFCYLNDDFTHRLGEGKDCIFIFSQGNADEKAFLPYFTSVSKAMQMLGFNVKKIIIGNGLTKLGMVKDRPELLEQAYQAGQMLAG
ncbi:MAG: flavodoxin family protein [Candidatus Riflebacteria bacterium]|nr:flavodoxin family protein [Candidatus Riflebacteria bacterium]